MSYCLNPSCSHPKNPPQALVCRSCGIKLLLRDRYRVIKILGKGGFGATYIANDLSLPGQPCCVVKQLRPASDSPEVFQMAKELFEREAETLGKIGNHPQIPRLLDYFEANKQFYLVQEYVSGRNLHQEVKKNGPFSEAGVRQFLSELLPLLKHIHAQRVIHRDIKPANILRREEDRKLVLIDFGAVKNQVSSNSFSMEGQTALTAFAVGTAGYAPPEQLSMRPVYASDVYSVGVTCLYLLTGKSPKNIDCDTSTGEMLWQKYVNVSDHLAQVLTKMLEASVRYRYKSADEALEALDMEPYLDSLAQGLVSPAKAEGPSSGFINPQSAPKSASGFRQSNPDGSATSKLAMAIRARRERRRQETNSFNSEPMSAFGSDRAPKTQVSRRTKKSRTERLDAKAVVKSYLKGRRDFAQQTLYKLDFQGVNLSKCIFHQANLRKTNFQEADLSNVDFGQANLSMAMLRKAVLCRAYLGYANLEGADLRGADLQFAHFKHANLKQANLCGANLANAQITEEQLAMAKTNWSTVLPNGKRSFW